MQSTKIIILFFIFLPIPLNHLYCFDATLMREEIAMQESPDRTPAQSRPGSSASSSGDDTELSQIANQDTFPSSSPERTKLAGMLSSIEMRETIQKGDEKATGCSSLSDGRKSTFEKSETSRSRGNHAITAVRIAQKIKDGGSKPKQLFRVKRTESASSTDSGWGSADGWSSDSASEGSLTPSSPESRKRITFKKA